MNHNLAVSDSKGANRFCTEQSIANKQSKGFSFAVGIALLDQNNYRLKNVLELEIKMFVCFLGGILGTWVIEYSRVFLWLREVVVM